MKELEKVISDLEKKRDEVSSPLVQSSWSKLSNEFGSIIWEVVLISGYSTKSSSSLCVIYYLNSLLIRQSIILQYNSIKQ